MRNLSDVATPMLFSPGQQLAAVRVVIVGHVDHGKSTLIGRLIYEAGALPEGKEAELQAIARRRGMELEWASLTDAFEAERDYNVTIDTAQAWLRLMDRSFVLIDAPGHREFVKNMVTGAAAADAAVLVTDVREGLQEQSRRHANLLKMLGVSQAISVVNKMDAVQYSEREFRAVSAEIGGLMEPLGFSGFLIVPAAARDGENLARPSSRMPWYTGPSVLDALGAFQPRHRLRSGPLRLPVQDVYRVDDRRVVVGRVESGCLGKHDPLSAFPGCRPTVVANLETWPPSVVPNASAGESIALTLTDDAFVERGTVLAAGEMPAETVSFSARIFWLGRRPLVFGRSYRLRLATQEVGCTIALDGQVLDGATLEPAPQKDTVGCNDVADVRVRATSPIVVDRYSDVAQLGRFVLLDDLEIAGGGVVIATFPLPEAARPGTALLGVTPAERVTRNGHCGAVVWLTGLPGSGKSTLARRLERVLFDAGRHVSVLDGDEIRRGLGEDLGFGPTDRAENIRRTAEVARLFADTGCVAITALISPCAADRLRARSIVSRMPGTVPFVEVYVDAPLSLCEARDPKGLYALARDGRVPEFTGVSAPYEPPCQPDLTVRTGEHSIDECVVELVNCLLPLISRSSR